MRSVRDVLKAAVADDATKYQFLHECTVGAKAVKAKKGEPAHVRVEFATQAFNVKDLLFPSQASHVGVVIWIPAEIYRKAEAP